ncbi:Uncharacterized protein OBRU01_24147, partial [Operophtera brumata]
FILVRTTDTTLYVIRHQAVDIDFPRPSDGSTDSVYFLLVPENGLLSYENPNYHLDPSRLESALYGDLYDMDKDEYSYLDNRSLRALCPLKKQLKPCKNARLVALCNIAAGVATELHFRFGVAHYDYVALRTRRYSVLRNTLRYCTDFIASWIPSGMSYCCILFEPKTVRYMDYTYLLASIYPYLGLRCWLIT